MKRVLVLCVLALSVACGSPVDPSHVPGDHAVCRNGGVPPSCVRP